MGPLNSSVCLSLVLPLQLHLRRGPSLPMVHVPGCLSQAHPRHAGHTKRGVGERGAAVDLGTSLLRLWQDTAGWLSGVGSCERRSMATPPPPAASPTHKNIFSLSSISPTHSLVFSSSSISRQELQRYSQYSSLNSSHEPHRHDEFHQYAMARHDSLPSLFYVFNGDKNNNKEDIIMKPCGQVTDVAHE